MKTQKIKKGNIFSDQELFYIHLLKLVNTVMLSQQYIMEILGSKILFC